MSTKLPAAIASDLQTEVNKSGDTERVTSARCLEWVNESIRKIIRRYPGLRDVHYADAATFSVAEDEHQVDLTGALHRVAHVLRLKYIDATALYYYPLKPFPGGLERWDEVYPYIPGRNSGYAEYYQRRADILELDKPWSAAAAANGTLTLYYDILPGDMQTTQKTIAASPGGAVRSTNVVTITTTTAHGYHAGDRVRVAVTTLATGVSMDGDFRIASAPSTTAFTYSSAGADSTGGAGAVDELPILKDYDEELIALGKALALSAMGPKFRSSSVIEEAYAWNKIKEKIGAESPVEVSPLNIYDGP